MRVVFFGTPQFAAETLQFLLDKKVNIVGVVTRPDKAQGRSGVPVATPVKQVALKASLPVHQPVKCSHPEFTPILQQYQADLFVVVAYGEIIKEHVLAMPSRGCVNVHASLLPRYRGAAPIQRCIMEGETHTGVSIMYMVREMDAGDVITSVDVPIGPDITAGELTLALCRVGSQALWESIHAIESGKAHRKAQDHSLATFAPKVELEDCGIDWRWPAERVHNLVRGANPEPGAWCRATVRGESKRLKIWKTQVVPDRTGTPGQILFNGREDPLVMCGAGAVRLLAVQLEGKKAMSGADLVRGNRDLILA